MRELARSWFVLAPCLAVAASLWWRRHPLAPGHQSAFTPKNNCFWLHVFLRDRQGPTEAPSSNHFASRMLHPDSDPWLGVHASKDPWRSQGPCTNSSSGASPNLGTSIRVNFVVTAAIAAAKLVGYKWGKVFAPHIGREKKFGHLFLGQNWAFFGPKWLFFSTKIQKKKK